MILMLLEKPVFPEGYYDGADLYLWIGVALLGIISSAIFLKRMKIAEHEKSIALFRGLAVLMLALAGTRFCYIYGMLAEESKYDLWINLGYSIGIGGMGYFLFEIERNFLTKTHYIFTMVNIVGLIMGILGAFNLVERDIPLMITTYVSTGDVVLLVAIYIYFIFISPGELKKRGLYNFLGIALMFGGITLDSELFLISLWPTIPLILAPILNIVGNLIVLKYQKLI